MDITFENLKSAVLKLVKLLNPNMVLEIQSEADPTGLPELHIRYAVTPFGEKLCLKEVSRLGEGSGAYYNLDEVDDFCKLVLQTHQKKVNDGKDLLDHLNKNGSSFLSEYIERAQGKRLLVFREV